MLSIQEFRKELIKSIPNYEKLYSFLQGNSYSEQDEPDTNGSHFFHHASSNINNMDIEFLKYLHNTKPNAITKPNYFGCLPIHKAVTALNKPDGSLTGFVSITSIKFLIELHPE